MALYSRLFICFWIFTTKVVLFVRSLSPRTGYSLYSLSSGINTNVYSLTRCTVYLGICSQILFDSNHRWPQRPLRRVYSLGQLRYSLRRLAARSALLSSPSNTVDAPSRGLFVSSFTAYRNTRPTLGASCHAVLVLCREACDFSAIGSNKLPFYVRKQSLFSSGHSDTIANFNSTIKTL